MIKLRKSAKTGKVQPRKRVVPWWRGRSAVAAYGVIAVLFLAGGGWWSWLSGWPQRVADDVRVAAIDKTMDLGFVVQEVFVIGRKETPRAVIKDALGIDRGSPILDYDLEAARQRVLALPWISRASVERLLPDTLVVRVTERRPLALWQMDGRFALVDEKGDVIVRHGLNRFRRLPLVVGEGAPAHAASLIKTLASQPVLNERVEAVVRVGHRRWNVRLSGGIDVQLPERDAAAAWRRLAEYQNRHAVLDHGVQVIDLRLEDRLVVRLAPPPPAETVEGQDT